MLKAPVYNNRPTPSFMRTNLNLQNLSQLRAQLLRYSKNSNIRSVFFYRILSPRVSVDYDRRTRVSFTFCWPIRVHSDR